jgi:biopolymer transport protein TolR
MAKLSAAQRGKIRRLSQPKELAPDEEGGELNIVPFLDIIVNILIFVLATVAVTFTSTIETNPPAGKSAGVRSSIPQESTLKKTKCRSAPIQGSLMRL